MLRSGTLVATALSLLLATAASNAPTSWAATASSPLFGAYRPPAPNKGMDAILKLEKILGRRLDIVSWYQAWGRGDSALRTDWISAAAKGGRRVMITWEPLEKLGTPNQPAYSMDQILSGRHDTYIKEWARGLKAYGKIVYLRLMHEMNGNWYPWGGTVNGNTPKKFISAWRYIHNIFSKQGATNVRWIWSPYAVDWPKTNIFEKLYPGGRYVDILGLGGLNWGSCKDNTGGWRSFDEIYSSAYKRLVKLGSQPVWLTEMASHTGPGDKAKWVTDMFRSVRQRYLRAKAVVWFDALRSPCDWRITSSSSVVTAFRKALA